MQQLNLEILMAILSITNNTLLISLIATFSQQLIININNNAAHTQNKYSPNTDNNNNPLQSLSQIHKSTYTKIKRKPTTTTFEIEKIIKSLKSKDSHGSDKISTKLLK